MRANHHHPATVCVSLNFNFNQRFLERPTRNIHKHPETGRLPFGNQTWPGKSLQKKKHRKITHQWSIFHHFPAMFDSRRAPQVFQGSPPGAHARRLEECEHWRGEIIRGVAKKIAEIQNAALGAATIGHASLGYI